MPIASGYDGWAVSYDGENNGCFPMRDDVLTPMLDRLTPRRVLDTPCGTGAVGVDVSEGMLARARQAAPEAHFVLGDMGVNGGLWARPSPYRPGHCGWRRQPDQTSQPGRAEPDQRPAAE